MVAISTRHHLLEVAEEGKETTSFFQKGWVLTEYNSFDHFHKKIAVLHLAAPLRYHVRALFNRVPKVIPQLLWFCIATLCDWLKKLALLPRPIRSETKTNRDLLARVFPRLARATFICFDL